MPTPTHAFGRTRSGRSPWPISIAAGVVAGMICALAAAAVNGGTSAWRLGLAIFAATAPMLTAGVWAVVVDRSTIRGAAARPEQSVEAAWLDRAAAAGFMDVLALAAITPGPMAVNLATFAGYQVGGLPGSIVATAGVCLPGAILLLALGMIAIHLRERPAFRAAMRGLMPALAGLLAATALRLGLALVPAGAAWPPWSTTAIFAAVFGLVLWKNPHPALLMFGAAAAGLLVALV